jgi:hypothetical protein
MKTVFAIFSTPNGAALDDVFINPKHIVRLERTTTTSTYIVSPMTQGEKENFGGDGVLVTGGIWDTVNEIERAESLEETKSPDDDE